MDDKRLAEIREREQAASKGPWAQGDAWRTAGCIFDANRNRVGEGGAYCAYCHLGEPEWVGERDINGTVMLAHRHRVPDPWAPEHLITNEDGGYIAGNYDYEEGGIVRAEDTAFVAHARQDIPDLLAEVERLRKEVASLEEDSAKLSALESAGVDNWQGYDYAMEILHGEES